jgi:hypothetical protein
MFRLSIVYWEVFISIFSGSISDLIVESSCTLDRVNRHTILGARLFVTEFCHGPRRNQRRLGYQAFCCHMCEGPLS